MTPENSQHTKDALREEDTSSGHQTFEGTNLISDLPDQDGSTSLQVKFEKVRPQDLGGTVPLASYIPESFDAKKVGPNLISLGCVTEEEWKTAQAAVGADSVLDVLQLLMRTPGRWGELDGKPMPVLTKYQVQHILSDTAENLRLQHYLILDRIDAGAMGEVFRGWNTALSRIEAIKTFRLEKNWSATQSTQGVALERFEQEARILAALVHPSITTVYHAGRDHGVSFIAMEHVSGQNLKAIIDTARKSGEIVPVWWSVERVIAIAEALHHAHKKGIIHRDVKPKNIMITKDNELKILDLGIARLAASSQNSSTKQQKELTQHHVGMGTPEVMPPEQWADATAVTPASDIYSLGCTFYFMLTTRMPFKRDDMNTIMVAHISEQPKPPSELRPDVPPGLDAVLMNMLAKDPDDRYQSCEDLIRALTPYADPKRGYGKANQKKGISIWVTAAILLVSLGLSGTITAFVLKYRNDQNAALVIDDENNRKKTEKTPLNPQLGSEKPSVDPNKTDPNKAAPNKTDPGNSGKETSSSNSGAVTPVTPDPEAGDRRQAVKEIAAELLSEIKDVWKEADQYVAPLLDKIVDGMSNEKFSPKLAADRHRIQQLIGKRAWQSVTAAYLKVYREQNDIIWKSDEELETYVQQNAKDVTDSKSFQELKQLVLKVNEKRIPEMAELWLREYQSQNSKVWPNVNELFAEAKKARDFATITSPLDLNNFKTVVQAMTESLQNPFDHMQVLASNGKEVEDYANKTLIADVRRVLELHAKQPPLPLEIKILPKDPRAGLKNGEVVDIYVKAAVKGYLCLFDVGENGEIKNVLQSDRAHSWDKGQNVFFTRLAPGHTEMVAVIVDEDWSQLAQKNRPANLQRLDESTGVAKGEILYYSSFSAMNFDKVVAAFQSSLAAKRVFSALVEGKPYPLANVSGSAKSWACGKIKVNVSK